MVANKAEPDVVIESISPQPNPRQRHAIEEALQAAWPKPTVVTTVTDGWRFSGRPWSKRLSRYSQ